MSMKIFQMDPRMERLPKKTGIGGRLQKFTPPPIVDPKQSLDNNRRFQESLAQFSVSSPEQVRQSTLDMLHRMVESANRHIEANLRFKGLVFGVHEDSNRMYVTIRDQNSGEVLKTIPSDEALDLAARLQDISGLLMDVKA